VALAFARSCRRHSDRTGIVLATLCLGGLAAKALFEWGTGRTVFVSNLGEHVVPVPLAHLIGGAVGAIGHFFRNICATFRRGPAMAWKIIHVARSS
jgi:hypothetical protein